MPYSLTAAFTAVFVWWLTTGIILYAVRRYAPHKYALPIASVLLILMGLGSLENSAAVASPDAAYIAFFAILGVWGGIEISFLSGWITGPNRAPWQDNMSGSARFWSASRVVLWHEILISIIGIYLIQRFSDAANAVPILTYAVLWSMRLSAKLNLYLGVRNTGEAFLPDHMKYMGGYFSRRSMNLLFPFSITIATLLSAWLFHKALSPSADAYEATAYTLVAMLAALAVIEHWFLMLPLDIEALWSWGLTKPSKAAKAASLSMENLGIYNSHELNRMLQHIAAGSFGVVNSLCGTVRCQEGWLAVHLVDGLAEMRRERLPERRASQITITGYLLDTAGLRAAFESCAARSSA